MKTVEEEIKKAFINKWLLFEDNGHLHYFYINKVYKLENYINKSESIFFALYYAKIVDRSKELVYFTYIKDVISNLEVWESCSFIKEYKLPKRLRKEITKIYLRDNCKRSYPENILSVFRNQINKIQERYNNPNGIPYFSDKQTDLM